MPLFQGAVDFGKMVVKVCEHGTRVAKDDDQENSRSVKQFDVSF